MNILEKLVLKIIRRKVSHWFEMERSLLEVENSFRSSDLSPEKSWPDPDKFLAGGEIPFNLRNIKIIGPYLRSCIHEGQWAITSLKENPSDPKPTIASEALKQFETYAKSQGIGALGYTKLPRRLIFRERAVLFDNAIVLLMEMDRSKISKAPSVETFKMVFETYDSLGKVANSLTDYLRKMGFGAQSGHPLGGLVLYPPLATRAGLGIPGYHGLLISPQFGPRQRIGAVFTNIENLPFAEDNPHSWIRDFCDRCRRCIRTCPSKAIYDKSLVHPSERETHISREKCLPVFVAQQGCTVCVKDCIFSFRDYEEIKGKFIRAESRKHL